MENRVGVEDKKEMYSSFEKMVNNKIVIRLFRKLESRDYITRMERGVFNEAFVHILKTKNISLKYVTRFLALLCKLDTEGEFIKQSFDDIYLRDIDDYLKINSGKEQLMIENAEAIAISALHFYLHGTFEHDDLKQILVTLSSPSTVASFANIVHLRIVFFIIMFLPRDFQKCYSKSWIPEFTEKFVEFFKTVLDSFEEDQQQPDNPIIREYNFLLMASRVFLREYEKTEIKEEDLESLQKNGIEIYLKYRCKYNEFKKRKWARIIADRLNESVRLFRQIEWLKIEIEEKERNEGDCSSLLEQLNSTVDITTSYAEQAKEAGDNIKSLDRMYSDGREQFLKWIDDLKNPEL